MRLGVCYYPEHWPQPMWTSDAARMKALGLEFVRIGEFAWSRIEPARGRFEWEWLDRAVETLADAGLSIVMGTPTATPPHWLLSEHPDMIGLDADGRPRGFGSRRHYCFSSDAYRNEAARIAGLLADRYGAHPAIRDWQIDNEYGCHSTVVSYSAAAAAAFRIWCESRYGTVEALNAAWGTVFWSMEISAFDEIERPNLTVTEPNPALVLDWRRFSSDQVMRFHSAQADAIRARAPGARILHNTMGFFTDYDHHALARDLDAIGWDSYPLGFLDSFDFPEREKRQWARTGHPDVAAFNHDRYRGVGPIPFGVLEQQPGPVNWAAHNPAPLDGMVRFWTLEAFAHGADFVSYFRWRQCPFAQEQMHAGLLLPDDTKDQGYGEVEAVAQELARLPDTATIRAPVALVFDEESQWVVAIQRQGAAFDTLRLVFRFYTALRRLGLDIDIIGPDDPIAGYRLVVVPCLPILGETRLAALLDADVPALFGPRTGSKTSTYAIPPDLAPGPLGKRLGLRIPRVASYRPGMEVSVPEQDAVAGALTHWRETALPSTARVLASTVEGAPALLASPDGKHRYLAGWPDDALLESVVRESVASAGIETIPLAEGLRIRRRGALVFAFHSGPGDIDVPVPAGATLLVGSRRLAPGGVAVWQTA